MDWLVCNGCEDGCASDGGKTSFVRRKHDDAESSWSAYLQLKQEHPTAFNSKKLSGSFIPEIHHSRIHLGNGQSTLTLGNRLMSWCTTSSGAHSSAADDYRGAACVRNPSPAFNLNPPPDQPASLICADPTKLADMKQQQRSLESILEGQETKLLDLTHEFNLKKQQLFSSASLLPASQRVQEQDQESLALEKKRELAFLARKIAMAVETRDEWRQKLEAVRRGGTWIEGREGGGSMPPSPITPTPSARVPRNSMTIIEHNMKNLELQPGKVVLPAHTGGAGGAALEKRVTVDGLLLRNYSTEF